MSQDGLIYGYVLDGQGGGRSVGWEDVAQWNPKDGVLWLHFEYSNERVKAWLQNESELDSLVVSALLTEESRPRTSLSKDNLLLALRGVNLSPGSDPEDMVGIRVWSDGKRVISTRKRRMLTAADISESIADGDGPRTASEFIVMLSDRLIARMQQTIEDTEDQVAEIEEMILTTESYALRAQIAEVRRTVISLRRYLAPQREAMQQLQADKVSWISSQDRQSLREVTDHLIRYIEDLDSVRDRAAVSQEELANRLSEQMNKRMYVLSMVAAIFLPLGFLTGLLGINVGGIPGAENSWSFWIFLLMLVAVVLGQYQLFKRNKWL